MFKLFKSLLLIIFTYIHNKIMYDGQLYKKIATDESERYFSMKTKMEAGKCLHYKSIKDLFNR